MLKNISKPAAVLLAASLLLAGCGESAEPSSSAAPIKPPSSSTAPAAAQPATATFESRQNDLKFDYPADWTVEESANTVMISSPAAMGSAIMIADVTYEVSLFLAGRGDLETSIDALVDKYADLLAGGSAKENYSYSWNESGSGAIQAKATFTLGGDSNGLVDVEQVGSRVFLSIHVSPSANSAQVAEVYGALNASFSAGGTDGTLEAADLSDLGFPEAPNGFERFYSPVTGQFFFFPSEWTLISNAHDNAVILANDQGALMLTENWTDSFYPIYNNNGKDEVECFDTFLNECAAALEQIYGEVPRYSDFQQMATENQELIKATFNYTVGGGTGRCFAELGVREFNNQDKIQATLCLYKPGDQYSIDMFSIIMDSTIIYYPEL